jgi:hypothetical protein
MASEKITQKKDARQDARTLRKISRQDAKTLRRKHTLHLSSCCRSLSEGAAVKYHIHFAASRLREEKHAQKSSGKQFSRL